MHLISTEHYLSLRLYAIATLTDPLGFIQLVLLTIFCYYCKYKLYFNIYIYISYGKNGSNKL